MARAAWLCGFRRLCSRWRKRGESEVRERLDRALRRLLEGDRYLLENDLSERCIAARLAMYLREEFKQHDVDVEYNREADVTKRLRGLPDECYRRRNRQIEARVAVPDIIVHHRGFHGPNLLVIEMKKTSNPAGMDCDRLRLAAFREQLGYSFGALVECDTALLVEPVIRVSDWLAG